MPGSIKHSLQRDLESGLTNQDATCMYRVLLTRVAAVLVILTLNTLAKYILKPAINKCLKDTSIQQHMFSLLCTTKGTPHQRSSLSFLQPPWLSLSPSAIWEVEAQLIHHFVVETPRAQLQATGYQSRHEKFRADINKSLKVKCVSRYPPCLSVNTKATVSERRNQTCCVCAQKFLVCAMYVHLKVRNKSRK